MSRLLQIPERLGINLLRTFSVNLMVKYPVIMSTTSLIADQMVLLAFTLLSILALSVVGAEVKLKGTTIRGVDLTESKVEFFGGKCG